MAEDTNNSNSSSINNQTSNETNPNKKNSIVKYLIILIILLFIVIIGYYIFLRLSSIFYPGVRENGDITKGLTIEKCMENDQQKGCLEFFYKPEIAEECSKLNIDKKNECLKKAAMTTFRPELCDFISNEDIKGNCKADVILINERPRDIQNP